MWGANKMCTVMAHMKSVLHMQSIGGVYYCSKCNCLENKILFFHPGGSFVYTKFEVQCFQRSTENNSYTKHFF